MRILFVAMHASVHTARWIGQLRGLGWDIHLFPMQHVVTDPDLDLLHPDLRDITVHHPGGLPPTQQRADVRISGSFPFSIRNPVAKHFFAAMRARKRSRQLDLVDVIRKIRPDVLHSMEFQLCSYFVLPALPYLTERPPWVVSNWGSDVYLFGRLASDRDAVRAVLENCDYYLCECRRDVPLARRYGLKGEILPIMPVTGGFDVAAMAALGENTPPSRRHTIVLKGYQHWAGRALVGIRALELCADALAGYRVAVVAANRDVSIAAELAAQNTGIEFTAYPYIPRDDHLRLLADARIHLGLSISDATSTSFLESLITGAFPIQSSTACADEWIEDGATGILVPPEDPHVIAAAVRRAIADDPLVDEAARRNYATALARLDLSVIRPQAIEMYEHIVRQGRRTTN
jgi:glycosyltransferase involved in cell wall biosynthesis